jgi:hypothetical protein
MVEGLVYQVKSYCVGDQSNLNMTDAIAVLGRYVQLIELSVDEMNDVDHREGAACSLELSHLVPWLQSLTVSGEIAECKDHHMDLSALLCRLWICITILMQVCSLIIKFHQLITCTCRTMTKM